MRKYKRGDKWDVFVDNKNRYVLCLNDKELMTTSYRKICDVAKQCYIKNDMTPLEILFHDNTMMLSNYYLDYANSINNRGNVLGRIRQYEEKDLELKRVIKCMRSLLLV